MSAMASRLSNHWIRWVRAITAASGPAEITAAARRPATIGTAPTVPTALLTGPGGPEVTTPPAVDIMQILPGLPIRRSFENLHEGARSAIGLALPDQAMHDAKESRPNQGDQRGKPWPAGL